MKDQKIALLEHQLEVARREKILADKEIAIQAKLTEIAQREAEIYKSSFEREKDLTDRALKLVEISKPKSDWQMQGLALLGAILLGVAIGK